MRTIRVALVAVVTLVLLAGCSSGSVTPTVSTSGAQVPAAPSASASKSADASKPAGPKEDPGQSLDAAGDKKVTIVYKIRRGMEVTYRIKAKMSADIAGNGKRLKQRATVDYRLREKVLSIHRNGDIGYEVSYRFLSMTVNGKSQKLPPNVTFEALVAKNGEVKEVRIKGKKQPEESQRYAETTTNLPLTAPTKPVAVGETWRVDKDIKLPNDEGTIGVHVGYKLARVSNSGGHRTAAIQQKFNIPTTLAAARPGYIVDSTSTFDGAFEGVISLEDGTMERGRLKATQTGTGLTHLSGFGLPFINSSVRIVLEAQIVKLAQQRAV